MRAPHIAALTCALLACACGKDEPPPERNSVLLITLDTTRADVLSCLGGPAGLTSNLDALAAEGVLYEAARTVAPLTMPAHASIFTGLYPPRHGVRDNNVRRLPASAETVAELARSAGFQTAAFVSSIAVDSAFGFDQGFELYDEPAREMLQADGHEGARNAAQVVNRALAWLEDGHDPAQPFFAWIHVWDPHAPYTPVAAFLQPAGGDPYAAEVFGADLVLGKLFQTLKQKGLWDELCVIVVADHGEGRGDLGEPTHGTYLWESTIRVPLIVRDPGGSRAGTRSIESVSVADLAPTALDAMGLRVPGDLDGQSLWRRTLDPDRGVYFESYTGWTYYGWSPLVGWADSGGAYLQSANPRIVPPALGNPNAPAAAGRLVNAEDADFVTARQREIARVFAAPKLKPDDENADPGLLADLRGIGYVATGVVGEDLPNPFDPDALARPCPMDRLDEHLDTLRAIDLAALGSVDEAIEALNGVLERNPNNVKVLGRASDVLMANGRLEEAHPLLERLLAVAPPSPGVHFQLGVVTEAAGDLDAAGAHWRAALLIDPGHVQSRAALVRWHEARGEVEEAARVRAGS